MSSPDESLWVRAEASGVPIWSTGTPRRSTRAAVIVRAGIADETPETRGWLAVAKDLALAEAPPEGVTVSGGVRGLHTTLIVSAEPELLAGGVTWLLGRFVKPDLDLLARVVAARVSRPRSPNLFGQLLRRELGAQGYGLAGFPEYGVPRLDSNAMRWFSSVVFTAENMALCFDGVMPTGLDVQLGSDERLAPPDRTVQTRRRPAVTEVESTDVGMLGIVTEDRVAYVLAKVLAERATRRLRQQRPTEPAVRWHVSRLDDARAAILVSATADQTPASFVHGCLEAALRDVVQTGAAPHELNEVVVETRRRVSDPSQHFDILQRAALDDLLGLPARSPHHLLREAESITPIEVAELAVRVEERHLVGLPAGSDTANPYNMPVDAPAPIRARTDGQSAFPSIDSAFPDKAVYVLPGLVHLRTDEQHGLDIPVEEVALLLAYGDGGRVIITRDGFEHAVEPTLYERGALLVGALDALVPSDLCVPQPARAWVPQPLPVAQRKIWDSLKERVAPVAANLPIPLTRTGKHPQFDAARRLNDGLD